MKDLPVVYNYTSPLLFITDWLEYEKTRDEKLSLRKWAKILDIDTQDLFLVMAKKKKISSHMASKIAQKLHLDANEDTYLQVLINYENAKNLTEKKVLETVLLELAPFRGQTFCSSDQSIFSHWVHMAILSMLTVQGVNHSEETLSEALLIDIPKNTISAAIDRLLKLGIISKNGDGFLARNQNRVVSQNDAFKKSPHQYFQQVSELAEKAAELDVELREFQCFSMAINPENFQVYKDLIRGFREKLSALNEKEDSKQVYQFNFQAFPLSCNLKDNLKNFSRDAGEHHMIQEPAEKLI